MKVGLSATDAHAYASEAFEPRAAAFKPLRDAFDEHRALYVAKVQPIRHQVFAHAGRIAREERDALFSDLFVRELEGLVVFPLRLASAFFRLYHDGIEPVLADNVPTVITDVSLPHRGSTRRRGTPPRSRERYAVPQDTVTATVDSVGWIRSRRRVGSSTRLSSCCSAMVIWSPCTR